MFSTDSQITLVNDGTLELLFTKWSILNTTLHQDGSPVYKISTTDVSGAKTIITDGTSGVELARIVRPILPMMSEKVIFADGGEVKVKKWMQRFDDNEG